MSEKNLPVIAENKKISNKIKNVTSRAGKIVGYSLATFGSAIIALSNPWLTIPSLAVGAYTAQKLLNNTVYKSYKDLIFISKKNNGNIKIFQDALRPDILREVSKLNNIEKAGFMQLQAIIGLSKFDSKDKNGDSITYETDSHGFVRKTFKALEDLGYIENYEEQYKKDTNLIVPRLAFGNIKDIPNKVQMYNIKFKRTNKPIDLNDEQLIKKFPLIFSGKRGLLAKRNYSFIMESDGKLGINYSTKSDRSEINNISKISSTTRKQENKVKNEFEASLKQGVPTLEQQADFSKENIAQEIASDTKIHKIKEDSNERI